MLELPTNIYLLKSIPFLYVVNEVCIYYHKGGSHQYRPYRFPLPGSRFNVPGLKNAGSAGSLSALSLGSELPAQRINKIARFQTKGPPSVSGDTMKVELSEKSDFKGWARGGRCSDRVWHRVRDIQRVYVHRKNLVTECNISVMDIDTTVTIPILGKPHTVFLNLGKSRNYFEPRVPPQ